MMNPSFWMTSTFCARSLVVLVVGFLLAADAAALPPVDSADFDAMVGFRVNGKPFFPILLYNPAVDDAALAEYRDFGFNVLACHAKDCDGLPAKGFYGAVHVGKKLDSAHGVFMTIGADSPALIYKKDLLKQVTESNAKVKALVPNRPLMNAIGYWEDEPAGVYAGKLPSKEKYDDLVRAIEVSAPYLYPVPYQPVRSVGEAVARARAAVDGKTPLLPIVQLFAWKADDRYPTPAELRCMTFLAVVEGGHGVGYFSYGHVTGKPKTTIAAAQPELWKSVKDLNREVARIGPKLIAGRVSDALALDKVDAGVRMKAVRDGAETLAVIVNGVPKRQDVKLRCKWAGRLLIEGAEAVEVKDGKATVTLEPFAVRVVGSRLR